MSPGSRKANGETVGGISCRILIGRSLVVVLALVLCLILAACASAETFVPVRATVKGIDQFGDIVLDLKQIDLEFGDSVDARFSGGYEAKAVPYYPDFYGKKDSTVLSPFEGTLVFGGVGCSLNTITGIEPGETVVISLEQKGRYREELEAYDINNATWRMEDQTDEAFRNAREIAVGDIRGGRLYRGSSPFDPEFGRIDLMGSYIQEHDFGCILDLADSPEKLASYGNLPEQTAAMIAEGRVIACHLGVDYLEAESMRRLGEGLAALADRKGPWLIQCNLGRDRTGVICAVVEALCGASYEEIVQDYMKSYELLHGILMDPDSLQYRLFKARIDEQLAAITGYAIEDLPDANLRHSARDYLMRCHMTQDQIDKLERSLTTP
jgi:hypothetical protein